MEAPPFSQIDTHWPADSLEFCPHAEAADIFVCGTYKLEESTQDQSEEHESTKTPQRRKGKCLVFRADESNGTWCVIRRVNGKCASYGQALIGGKSTAPRRPNVRRTRHEMVYPLVCQIASQSTATFDRSHSRSRPPRMAVAESEGRVRIFDWSSEEVYILQLLVIFQILSISSEHSNMHKRLNAPLQTSSVSH